MTEVRRILFVFLAVLAVSLISAQELQKIKAPDERYKVDILVVVAHPDDEGAVTPYLARAIYDLHKSVAVVYGTRGGSGGNDYRREHGPAMADVREIEARQACAKFGIDKVWFLGGKDTASQNVLNSLANWGHGESLEELVRIVRLTRPEVIITWLPSIFIGENHGDHQAAGVLATEAFDSAGDPSAFPAQLAGPTKVNETLLDGLQPWQVKKLYYFPDSSDDTIFKNTGPTYPTTGISPTRKLPYWRIAMETFQYHLTQYKGYIDGLRKMDEKALAAQEKNWGQPNTFTLGISHVPGTATGDVFERITPGGIPFVPAARMPYEEAAPLSVELGGPWSFYGKFRRAHGLTRLPQAAVPEIAIKRGATLLIPLELRNHTDTAKTIIITTKLPEGWTAQTGAGSIVLEPQSDFHWQVTMDAPKAETKGLQEIECRAESDGKVLANIRISVQLRNGGLPQN